MAWRLASFLRRHGGDYGTKDIQELHYGIWSWRRILNGACISISNLPENIAWQTDGPEARGPLKSGAWGVRPTCHTQTPPLILVVTPACLISASVYFSVRIRDHLRFITRSITGTSVAQWLWCCATNRKVAGSIPDGVIGIFHWHNLSDRTKFLGSTRPLTVVSTRSIYWG